MARRLPRGTVRNQAMIALRSLAMRNVANERAAQAITRYRLSTSAPKSRIDCMFPPVLALNSRGGTPTSVNLQTNRRSPSGAARFLIDAGDGWGISPQVCPFLINGRWPTKVPPPRHRLFYFRGTDDTIQGQLKGRL